MVETKLVSYPRDLINELLEIHQEIKREFINEFGKTKISNNSFTKKWLRSRDNSEIKDILKKIIKIMKQNTDLKTNYYILREIHAINPSFHEMWTFKDHLKADYDDLIYGMGGIKACKTSIQNDELKQGNLKRITTILLRYTILLENLLSSKLNKEFMDSQYKPSNNIKRDLDMILESHKNKKTNLDSTLEIMPILFRIVHYLLKKCECLQLKSNNLLKKWLEYAPCSINEGPIFIPKTDRNLIDVLSSIPSLEQSEIRSHLKKYYDVKEIM